LLCCCLGVDFTNILPAALAREDPKSPDRKSSHQCLFALLGSTLVKAVSKMLVKSTPSVNFINVPPAAFKCTDLKSAKRYWQLVWILMLLGSSHVKAACKHVGEIDPRSPHIPKEWPVYGNQSLRGSHSKQFEWDNEKLIIITNGRSTHKSDKDKGERKNVIHSLGISFLFQWKIKSTLLNVIASKKSDNIKWIVTKLIQLWYRDYIERYSL